MKSKPIDIISVGELLIDMISIDFAEKMDEVETFKRIVGGSPANLAMNMQRLGKNVRLVATVGQDDMGNFLMDYVKKLHLDTSLMRQTNVPTTLILVSRSKNVSNFEPYRGADAHINMTQLNDEALSQTAIFHTTCFALSKKPAQTNILRGAKRAVELGCQLSIDANYAPKIWRNRAEAQRIVAEYCSHGAYVKVSEVDWERLYGTKLTNPEEAAKHFLALGSKNVCVTLGGDGCFVADTEGGHFVPARKVDVKDTTGAGDAFWSGFLTARLDGHTVLNAAIAARRMAELKLGHFGPLPSSVDRSLIYEDLNKIPT
ncbi:MAG: carbohydrate kinase [Saprospiraceae bacterium]|nr:carbohydrate kinase [Saprospiraceae bacterium]